MTPDQKTDRQVFALDLLHIAANAYRTTPTEGCDRALAHAIRAARRAGLNARTVAAETHLTRELVEACLGRWAGDN